MNEWELIELLKSKQNDVELSIGDDCAVFRKGNENILITKDLLVEKSHFILPEFPLDSIGRKLVNSNVSDIVAMRGKPEYALLGIVIPQGFGNDSIEKLVFSIKKELKKYSVSLVGGDIVRGEKLTLSMTVVGIADNYVTRAGAKKDDIIFITGDLGYSKAGLSEFKEKGKIKNKKARNKYFEPSCRFDLLSLLSKTNINAMIDISDGFHQDLLHILKVSKVGAEIFLDKFKYNNYLKKNAEHQGLDIFDLIVNSGEEFELIIVAPKSEKEKLEQKDIFSVGKIVEKNILRYFYKDSEYKIKNLSFTHSF